MNPACIQTTTPLDRAPRGRLPAMRAFGVALPMLLLAASPSTAIPPAPDPSGHWAFARPRSHPLPEIGRPGWCRTPIDRFVLRGLEEAGLEPGDDASPEAILRRLSFTLTGLPPTPADLERFAADPGPEALAREIDRLLASPQYGERWARLWLDVARYADSNGQDENKAMAHAWRYRDWVVDAFNADLPIDDFIRRQIAGDREDGLAGEERAAAVTATGFLVLGPKQLAEQDKEKMLLDIVDEQVDTLGRAFLGMTFGCARCHDHVFDPVSQRDYFALAGIFRSTRTMADTEFVSRWNERVVATPEERAKWEAHQEAAARIEAESAALAAEADHDLRSRAKSSARRLLDAASPDSAREDARTAADATEIDEGWMDALVERWTAAVRDAPAFAGWRRWLGDADPDAAWVADPVLASLAVEPPSDRAEGVAVLADALIEMADAPAPEPQVAEGAVDEAEAREHALAGLRQLVAGDGAEAPGLFAPPEPSHPHWAPAFRDRREVLEARRVQLEEQAPPPPPEAMAVDESEPVSLRLHVRGDHLALEGPPIPRSVPDAIARFSSDPIPADASGRRQLADWITDPRHPLTARVFVNRVWQAHFGFGLVRTPDNFGLGGEAPTHPELLDWLAVEFIRSEWSLKDLHRLILTSRTWTLSSASIPSAEAIDPENRLLWRMPRRRLDAEMIRDALLAASGRLDLSAGGAPTDFKNHDYVPRDPELREVTRRALYLPVLRDRVHPGFALFDFAPPNASTGRRDQSVVPLQALYFLNSPFVADCAEALADRLLAEPADLAARVRLGTRLAWGRDATDREVARAREWIEAEGSSDGPRQAWTGWCHALFAANEFLYLD